MQADEIREWNWNHCCVQVFFSLALIAKLNETFFRPKKITRMDHTLKVHLSVEQYLYSKWFKVYCKVKIARSMECFEAFVTGNDNR